MKTKKEKILVLITAQEQSKHFITLGYDVAKETEGDLYILHIADTNDTENTNKMEQMQILAEYVCSLGGQFCFLWDFDIKNAVKKFVQQNHITKILVEPPLVEQTEQSEYAYATQTAILSDQSLIA